MEQARSQKIPRRSESSQMAIEPAVTEPLPTLPQPSTSGASFSESVGRAEVEIDPEAPEDYDELSAIASYASEWVESLSRDDLLSLAILSWHIFSSILPFNITDAAGLIGRALGKSDRSVREWQTTFNANHGSFSNTLQGKYKCDGVLWHSEDLNKQAVKYVWQNTAVKGKPNLTAGSFCQWINECLLVMQTLEPRYPRRVSVETAWKWLLELGFTVMDHKKGTYIDGHERSDVVEYRNKF